jgi:predicted negative regulator of RcsB-dependent stress response
MNNLILLLLLLALIAMAGYYYWKRAQNRGTSATSDRTDTDAS